MSAKALMIRTCDSQMRSHGGFVWPESGAVDCPDWDPTPECGGGLHGLLDGVGDYSLLSDAPDAKWLLVEVERGDVVEINGKVKVPRGEVVYCGDMCGALTRIAIEWRRLAAEADAGSCTTGDRAHAASQGDRAHAASQGYSAHAASQGDRAHAASQGYSAHAASQGYRAHAASQGDRAHAASQGYRAHAASQGDSAHAASQGYSAHAASQGYRAHAASQGYSAHAAALGPDSIAAGLGLWSTAEAGEDGTIVLSYWDDDADRHRLVVGYVGEDGIEAGVTYRVVDGQLVPEGGTS